MAQFPSKEYLLTSAQNVKAKTSPKRMKKIYSTSRWMRLRSHRGQNAKTLKSPKTADRTQSARRRMKSMASAGRSDSLRAMMQTRVLTCAGSPLNACARTRTKSAKQARARDWVRPGEPNGIEPDFNMFLHLVEFSEFSGLIGHERKSMADIRYVYVYQR